MITIKVDPLPARNFLTQVEREQLPFALKNAIADTALDVQKVQRQHDARIFTVRRPEWLERTVKITKFPKKSDLRATIAIQPPGATGKDRADIIAKFESDTAKESSKAGGHVAIPIRAKRNKRDIIIGKNRPKAFNFRHVGRAIRGDQGTFIVTIRTGAELILQRTKRGVFALYYLVRRVPITPDLQFVENAERTVDARFATAFRQRFEEAMRTAR